MFLHCFFTYTNATSHRSSVGHYNEFATFSLCVTATSLHEPLRNRLRFLTAARPRDRSGSERRRPQATACLSPPWLPSRRSSHRTAPHPVRAGDRRPSTPRQLRHCPLRSLRRPPRTISLRARWRCPDDLLDIRVRQHAGAVPPLPREVAGAFPHRLPVDTRLRLSFNSPLQRRTTTRCPTRTQPAKRAGTSAPLPHRTTAIPRTARVGAFRLSHATASSSIPASSRPAGAASGVRFPTGLPRPAPPTIHSPCPDDPHVGAVVRGGGAGASSVVPSSNRPEARQGIRIPDGCGYCRRRVFPLLSHVLDGLCFGRDDDRCRCLRTRPQINSRCDRRRTNQPS